MEHSLEKNHLILYKNMKLDDIEKVHPMRQIFWASIIQISVLALMGLSMLVIGYLFT